MKGKRQEKILEIIRTNDIETQEELTKKLSEAGFSSTQGTVSRDIRELKLTKVTGANGRQKYAPIQAEDIHVSSKYKRVLSEGILHMDNAVFQVITVSLFPFPQSLSTADNPCNVPSMIIGD